MQDFWRLILLFTLSANPENWFGGNLVFENRPAKFVEDSEIILPNSEDFAEEL